VDTSSIEEREVARLLTDVERARAALDKAFDDLERAVALAVVDAGATWAQIGTRVHSHPQAARRDFLDAVNLYRDTWPAYIGRGDLLPGGDLLASAVTAGLQAADVPDDELDQCG